MVYIERCTPEAVSVNPSRFELITHQHHYIVEKRQQTSEGIDAFFFTMTQMRSRLDISIPENEMVKIRNRVYPIAVSSVEELRRQCVAAVKIFCRKEQHQHIATLNMRL